MSNTPGLMCLGICVIPDSKFVCGSCGAEWDARRGNKITHEGQVCGSLLPVVVQGRQTYSPCQGVLKGKHAT